jgi:hypothetical protein
MGGFFGWEICMGEFVWERERGRETVWAAGRKAQPFYYGE